MGDVVHLVNGRAKRGKKLPKPIECKDCEEPVETARVQAVMRMNAGIPLRPMRCISCQSAFEARERRVLANTREDDIVVIRR